MILGDVLPNLNCRTLTTDLQLHEFIGDRCALDYYSCVCSVVVTKKLLSFFFWFLNKAGVCWWTSRQRWHPYAQPICLNWSTKHLNSKSEIARLFAWQPTRQRTIENGQKTSWVWQKPRQPMVTCHSHWYQTMTERFQLHWAHWETETAVNQQWHRCVHIRRFCWMFFFASRKLFICFQVHDSIAG